MAFSKFGAHMRYMSVSALALSAALITLPAPASAQLTSASSDNLDLAPDSPFRNPNIIYLEADDVLDNQEQGILTAKGSVDARYQDRTLRADEIVYNINSGRVVARGNVVLTEASGATQYADKIELSDKLQSGTARDFTARFPQGGVAAAAFAVRRSDEGIDLYNAYYTACEACADEDGKTKKPTWRIKARQVTQDKADQMIHYKDAVFEFKGIPLFYTPYLAHPDPSSERRSGWMIPFGGRSGSYGVFYEQPYYWAISDYSEATFTPRVMERVNPLIEATYTKNFYSGKVELEGSFTYEDWFDSDGDSFSDADFFSNPDESLRGTKWRSHLFARGQFDLSDKWVWGFGLETATDDVYLDRYDIDEPDSDFGLYDGESRRLVEQLYTVFQDTNFRYSASSFGFQSLRTTVRRNVNDVNQIDVFREDDSILPVVLPKIELDHYLTDPIVGGRLHAFGDATLLTRSEGDDYSRFSGGLNWSKTMIAPGGIEVKPFAEVRADNFTLQAEGVEDREFSRSLGQVGIDARWTFVRPGETVNLTLEPRVQLTQSFGDAKIDQFSYIDTNSDTQSFIEDGIGIDLDQALLWSANKGTGYDIWQEGFRADIGGSIAANWDENRASLFLGQSFASDYGNVFAANSGLAGDKSDFIGQIEFDLFDKVNSTTRLRYNDDEDVFSRIDTSFRYTGDKLRMNWRYYKIDDTNPLLTDITDLPPEEISGSIAYDFLDDWGVRYRANRDIDAGTTRREELAFIYDDDCTLIEIFYEKRRNDLGLAGNSSGFGIRVALLTLGDFSPE